MFAGMFVFILLTLLAASSGTHASVSTNNETCTDSSCEVRFSYSGDSQTFEVPDGVTDIHFELSGASGGGGAKGGRVTGILQNPPSKLLVFVGGQGSVGSQVPGGFNGGGKSGGFQGDEGSGGGASDIRSAADLTSRLVVAGGGGGSGSRSGAVGGHGGGLLGGSGESSNGGGGGGGSQTAGGPRGLSSGGTNAISGKFGSGGAGGNSFSTGGGGGGGGWYGGGGGGADDSKCCSGTGGGGGGGGSSFAHPDFTRNVTHVQGDWLGHGYVILRYTVPIQIESFVSRQIDKNSGLFELALSRSVELGKANFNLSGISCKQTDVENLGSRVLLRVANCQHGKQTLIVSARGLDGVYPLQEVSNSLNFDGLGPHFAWHPGEIEIGGQRILISYELNEGALLPNHLEVNGCNKLTVETDLITLEECGSELVSIMVPANVFRDSLGNSSPATGLKQEFYLDRTSPEVVLENVVIDHESGLHSFQLRWSEQVFIDTSLILPSKASCAVDFELTDRVLSVFGSCDSGSVVYLLPAHIASDPSGNLGPSESLSIPITISHPDSLPKPIGSVNPAPIEEPVIDAVTEIDPIGSGLEEAETTEDAIREESERTVRNASKQLDSRPNGSAKFENAADQNQSGYSNNLSTGSAEIVSTQPVQALDGQDGNHQPSPNFVSDRSNGSFNELVLWLGGLTVLSATGYGIYRLTGR